MEKLEMDDDTVPHAILAHRRQELVEKATAQILKAERPSMDDDEMRQIEPWQTFTGVNFLR